MFVEPPEKSREESSSVLKSLTALIRYPHYSVVNPNRPTQRIFVGIFDFPFRDSIRFYYLKCTVYRSSVSTSGYSILVPGLVENVRTYVHIDT